MKRSAQAVISIIQETIAHCKRSELKYLAGSLAYTSVLSLIPLIVVAVFACQLLGYMNSWYNQIQPLIFQNLAPGAGQNIDLYLLKFIEKTKKSSVGIVGIGGLLLTSYFTFNQFHWAINRAMNIHSKERMYSKIIKVFLFIFLTPVLIALSTSLTAFLKIKGTLVAFFLDTMIFFMIYSVMPNQRMKFSELLKGSAVMAIVWEILKIIYAFYTKKAVNYSKFYGSFSALPLFLVWIYITWYAVLAGAAFTRAIHDHHLKKIKPREPTS